MTKLADIIEPIYREYTPVLQRSKITLDLDLENPILEIKNPATPVAEIKKYLEFVAVSGNRQGNIVISNRGKTVFIKDTTTVLSPEQRQSFTSDITSVKSRVGFGTTLSIKL
ncbi:hypothetical protein IKF76_00840 [Candidatus Saccharibacteria bacterium]|nr:hypothetical protein [Candidatus Saccharibacteria bacterium]